MANEDNPGQFGNRQDTQQQASKGGSVSGGNFKNDPQRASQAGKKGAEAQPTEAKAEGGRNSHSGGSS
jgi:general stress protein YciG